MVVADARVTSSRSIVAYVLAIIGLIIVTSILILVLLARRHSELLQSASIASDYHLTSTVRAGVIEQHLWEADRQIRPTAGTAATGIDRPGASALRRIVHLVEAETRALEAAQRQFADSTFEAPLRRLLEQSDRFALEVSTLTHHGQGDTTMIRESLAQLRLRLDQFSGLHWRSYASLDTSAARAAGWRRFSLLSIMIAVAGLIPIGIATRQIITALRERRMAEVRQRLLRSELDHRVRNNLAAVLSLADQTARTSGDLDEFVAAFTGRIIAMAKTHEALAGTKWSGLDLGHAASLTLATHVDARPARITIEGKPILLPANAALPLCLILHELSTNAVKHGALTRPDGRISLSWVSHGGCVDLSWVEHGGPVVIEPKSSGLGTQLIDGFIRHELRGDIAMDYRPEGLACHISLPLNGDSSD